MPLNTVKSVTQTSNIFKKKDIRLHFNSGICFKCYSPTKGTESIHRGACVTCTGETAKKKAVSDPTTYFIQSSSYQTKPTWDNIVANLMVVLLLQ